MGFVASPGMGEPSGFGGQALGVVLPTPAPEVLELVLRQRHGPLPRAAAIARLRRGPAGGYEHTGDPAEALERRRAANAKERERVRAPPKTPSAPPKIPNHAGLGANCGRQMSHGGGTRGHLEMGTP